MILWMSRADTRVPQVDANRDGKVSIDEFLKFLRRPSTVRTNQGSVLRAVKFHASHQSVANNVLFVQANRPQSAGRGGRKPIPSQFGTTKAVPLAVSVSDGTAAAAIMVKDEDEDIEPCLSRAAMASKYDSSVAANLRKRVQIRRTEITERFRTLQARADRIVDGV